MKPRESLLILIILFSIVALGLWRAISLSISHPHFMDLKNQFIPLNPNYPADTATTTLKAEQFIQIAQEKHPELKKYSENNLPPTSIETAPTNNEDVWGVVFETWGSGVPYLLEAQCYDVSLGDKSATLTGKYKLDPNSIYKPTKVTSYGCLPWEQGLADYIKAHISELSPVKESLGGKFYVTSIEIPDFFIGKVNYEDGHSSYKAEFTWDVGQDSMGVVTSFKLIK